MSNLLASFLPEDLDKIRNDPQTMRALRIAAGKARSLRAAKARTDANVFCELVLKDERTGQPIHQAPLHKQWHHLMNEHDRLLFWSHVEAGKTNQIAIGRVLWELGKDTSLRVCVVSNTKDLAMKMTRQVGQYIEKSDELHQVFPHLLPTDDPRLPWKAMALTVRRHQLGGKDPSIQACGVHGNVMGSRIDLLVLDDILDHENTHTPAPREDVYRWVRSTLFSRLTEASRVWIVGNAWHPDDVMHRLEREPRYHAFRFPVIENGALTWPERWSWERIKNAKADLGPLEYARQLLCQARDNTSARFKQEWIDRCLALGDGMELVEDVTQCWDSVAVHMPPDANMADGTPVEEKEEKEQLQALWALTGRRFVFTGVDLAVDKKSSSDLTSMFTIMVEPDGTRRVLDIQSGRWTGPETIEKVHDIYDRFGSLFIVENNAAQQYIVQFIQATSAIPVVPFTTGRNKAHPEFGVESLATELANGKWKIPNQAGHCSNEVHDWIQELLYYDPREHTGDRLMASWFAREGARRYFDATRKRALVNVRSL